MRVGTYFKSKRHYMNMCNKVVKDIGFDGVSEDLLVLLSDLYELSYDIQESGLCDEHEIRIPALWFSYQLREADTKDEVLKLYRETLDDLVERCIDYLNDEDPEIFNCYPEFKYEVI